MEKVTIKKLLKLLAQHGGSIVSTASLPVDFINQARASNRLYVDNNGLGYVWEPTLLRIPQTDKEVELFEKWYPLEVELPESSEAKHLETLLSNNNLNLKIKVTNEIRVSVATVMQWLGSNIGWEFLNSTLKKEGYKIVKITDDALGS